MRILFGCLLFLWANLSSAESSSKATLSEAPKSISLSSITSDYTDKKYELSIEVDHDNKMTKIKTYNVNKNRFREYGLDVLNNRISLVKAAGIELISLRCLEFNPDTGCKLEISYPKNVAVANFGEFQAMLKRLDKSWEIQTLDGHRIDRLHLISKKLLGLLVGIERIEVY